MIESGGFSKTLLSSVLELMWGFGLIGTKKVAYLLGAGATQAEIDFSGVEASVTMSTINENVYEMSKSANGEYSKLLAEFSISVDQDVEWMMSLLEGFSGPENSPFYAICVELRKLFRNYLLSQIVGNKIEPRLISTLLHLHKIYGNDMGDSGEEIIGILTTNYDSLIEDACAKVYDCLNVGYDFKPGEYKPNQIFPLLKLHGSFNWRIQGDCLEISKKFEHPDFEEQGGWIPPSVYKRPSEVVFTKVWGTARAVLTDCDVLRVIGSSLRNEDWALISLIFSSQISRKPVFEIELIIPEKDATGDDLSKGVMDRLKFLGKMCSLTHLPIYGEGDNPGGNVFYYWIQKSMDNIREKNGKINEDEFVREMLRMD
jgi:hypothetical protein